MASRGINKCIIVGNLGGDPEVKFLPNGNPVANFTVATSESWRDKATGEQREQTEWHSIVIYGKLAEIAGQYLKKGSQVYLEGQLRTRSWETNGEKRYKTEVVLQGLNGVMQMLGGNPNGGGNQGQSGYQQAPQQRAPQQQMAPQNQPQQAQPQYNEPPMDFNDDIPF